MDNLKRSLDDAAQFVKDTWEQTVMGSIKLSGVNQLTSNIGLRKLYADSIVLGSRINVGGSNLSRMILATSQVAADLEHGKGPFDMKPLLLASAKAKTGNNGKRFITVPFRHGVPGGSSNSNFPSMPKDIYKAAKALKSGGKLPATALVNHPARHHTIARNLKTGKVLAAPISYPHKASIYAGMKKVEKQYDKASSSKYMTFRRVSENSDPHSWWHPGYRPHNIVKGVTDYCRPAVEKMLMEAAKIDLVNVSNLSIGMSIEVR